MPIRKWYEQILEEIEGLKENLKQADGYNDPVQDLHKRFKAMFKKAEAAAGVDGATMADMKPFVTELKAIKKEFEKWKTGYAAWRKDIERNFSEIHDLSTKITDRTKELTKTEREHVDKHRQRIAAASARVNSAIDKMVQVEEQRFDDKISAEKKRKKNAGDAYDPTTAEVDIKATFDRTATRDAVAKKVKLNAAEAKAIDAAEKRIEVYEKIRAKKTKKYLDIKQALLDFQSNYEVEKIF